MLLCSHLLPTLHKRCSQSALPLVHWHLIQVIQRGQASHQALTVGPASNQSLLSVSRPMMIDTGHQKSACRMHISAWQQLGTNGADGCSVLETRNAAPQPQSKGSDRAIIHQRVAIQLQRSMLAQLEAPHSHTHTHSWQPTPLPPRMLASTHSMLKTANTGQGCKLQDMALARTLASPGKSCCADQKQPVSWTKGVRTPPRPVSPTHHMLDPSDLLVTFRTLIATCHSPTVGRQYHYHSTSLPEPTACWRLLGCQSASAVQAAN